jgi:hypothetical protein
MAGDELSEAMALSTEDTLILDNDKVYPEFRSHVRKLSCLACQKERMTQGDEFNFAPNLGDVSDPHHVRTVGAGGHDAENLVPLCRKHHGEIGSITMIRFQIKYNIDLRTIAGEIYQYFLNSGELQEAAEKTFAIHKRIVARIDGAKNAMMLVADEILQFVTTTHMNKPAYFWLGFPNAESYFTTPTSNNGLGLSQRTAYRMLNMAKVKLELGSERLAAELGTYKCSIVLPHLKGESDPQKKLEIAQAVAAMPMEDAVTWSREKTGLPDRRQVKHDAVVSMLTEFMRENGVNLGDVIGDEQWDKLAWQVVVACTGH